MGILPSFASNTFLILVFDEDSNDLMLVLGNDNDDDEESNYEVQIQKVKFDDLEFRRNFLH